MLNLTVKTLQKVAAKKNESLQLYLLFAETMANTSVCNLNTLVKETELGIRPNNGASTKTEIL